MPGPNGQMTEEEWQAYLVRNRAETEAEARARVGPTGAFGESAGTFQNYVDSPAAARARWNQQNDPLGMHGAGADAAFAKQQLDAYQQSASFKNASAERAKNSYLGQYDAVDRPGGGSPADQVGLDARALGDANSNPFKAYGWQGPSMGSREGLAGAADARGFVQANYNDANASMGLGMQSRGSQQDALGMYRNAAMGNGPTAAGAQFQQGLDASLRAQQSAANSARGGGMARAAALRNSMQNQGDMTLQASQQAAQLRAQEMQAAMGGYAGLASNIRGQDYGAAGQQAQMAQAQAGFGLNSQAQNDARNAFYAGQAVDVGKATTDLSVARERDRRAANVGNASMANALDQQDRDRIKSAAGAVANTAGSVFGAALGASDERVKEDVKPGAKLVDELLSKIQAHDYVYKSPKRHGEGRKVSVMAQELEASELGRRLVTTKDGVKMVDYAATAPVTLAAVARLNQRLDAIEGKKPKKLELKDFVSVKDGDKPKAKKKLELRDFVGGP